MPADPYVWWDTITGPRTLIDRIVHLLGDGVSVLLRLNDREQWIEFCRDYVHQRTELVDYHADYLTWKGDSAGSVARWLLNHISLSKAGLCPDSLCKQMEYIRKEHILSGRIIWIRGQGNLLPLLSFISEYRGGSAEEDGVFVVEVSPEFERVYSSFL